MWLLPPIENQISVQCWTSCNSSHETGYVWFLDNFPVVQILDPVDADQPVFRRVGLLQVGQIKVLVPYLNSTGSVKSSRGSEVKLLTDTSQIKPNWLLIITVTYLLDIDTDGVLWPHINQ